MTGVKEGTDHSEMPRGRRAPPQIIDLRDEIRQATKLDTGANQFAAMEDRLLKPLGGLVGWTADMRELAAVISRDILTHDPNVR